MRLRPERVIVPAGADRRLVTSGAWASWTDLALYLVSRFCGEVETPSQGQAIPVRGLQRRPVALRRPRQAATA